MVKVNIEELQKITTDVLIIGGGASGVCAAIQAARLGVNVILAEETCWLGGMLSAAGVSAIDGNHLLTSGLWGEFRKKVYEYYGGPEAVATGWVSHTQFEPHRADQILKALAAREVNLSVWLEHQLVTVFKKGLKITGARLRDRSGREVDVNASIVIEATEYGEVLALADCPHQFGRESIAETGEAGAPSVADEIIQDLTYVAILKDYGRGTDHTIERPANYDPEKFRGCCREWGDTGDQSLVDAQTMLNYGRLPNGKYMINWPRSGNDYHISPEAMRKAGRGIELEKAKEQTLEFVYLIQTQLGFSHLGLADDEFPTADKLALIPYIRESRRVRGLTFLKTDDLVDPYANPERSTYQSAIAVGNYPLDHHHSKCKMPEAESFPDIPAFSIPFGCLIPADIDGLIVAEKSIAVSHLVNGCTRLQPVVIQIGQAAGVAAALCIRYGIEPRSINIREVQQILLDANCWLMPVTDMKGYDPAFQSVQRMSLCGLIKGEGISRDWANEFHIHPDLPVSVSEFMSVLEKVSGKKTENSPFIRDISQQNITRLLACELIWQAAGEPNTSGNRSRFNDVVSPAVEYLDERGLLIPWIPEILFEPERWLSRKGFAVMIDGLFKPFFQIIPSIAY